jgi:hypothetical protein
MTEYSEAVEKQREVLKKEAEDNKVKSIDIRIKDGRWTESTTDYASGKRVIEFNDKRKNNIEEYHGEN